MRTENKTSAWRYGYFLNWKCMIFKINLSQMCALKKDRGEYTLRRFLKYFQLFPERNFLFDIKFNGIRSIWRAVIVGSSFGQSVFPLDLFWLKSLHFKFNYLTIHFFFRRKFILILYFQGEHEKRWLKSWAGWCHKICFRILSTATLLDLNRHWILTESDWICHWLLRTPTRRGGTIYEKKRDIWKNFRKKIGQ